MIGISVEFATPRVTEIVMCHFAFLKGVVPGSVRESRFCRSITDRMGDVVRYGLKGAEAPLGSTKRIGRLPAGLDQGKMRQVREAP